MRYHESILSAIGETPLVRLRKIVPKDAATILVKAEFMNPAGSIKDRMALHIIEKAEKDGRLKPGGIIVENTSGNTGLGVAMAAAVKGYRCIFTMPDKMSLEKINMLKAFGAEVVVTPTNVPADSPESYYETAKRIARETPGSLLPQPVRQPGQHRGPLPLDRPRDLGADRGPDRRLRGRHRHRRHHERRRQVPQGEEAGHPGTSRSTPIGSIYKGMFETGKIGTPHVYKVEGIGEDRVCKAMDFSVVDEVRQVGRPQVLHWVAAPDPRGGPLRRRLVGRCGGGGRSQLAKELGPGKLVVVILPDSGTRYITKYFSDAWMKDNGFLEPAIDAMGTVGELIGTTKSVVTAGKKEPAQVVIDRMKKGGYSQLPVVDERGHGVGMIDEVDLLTAILEKRMDLTQPIEAAIQPLEGRVTRATPVRQLMEIFNRGNVAVVVEAEAPVAIVTKIDVIDFLAKQKTIA
jgi:cystathionine beta-synthase